MLPSAPVFPGPHEETLELRMIAHQRDFADDLPWWNSSMASDPWAEHGVHNHAIMVAGVTLLAPDEWDHDDDPETDPRLWTPRDFCDQSLGAIENQLEIWATRMETDNAPWFVRSTFTGFIILDIEHPIRPVHFRSWFNDDPEAIPEDHVPILSPVDPLDDEYYYYIGHWDADVNGNPILLDHMINGFNRRILAARSVFPLAKIAVYPMIHTNSQGVCNATQEKNVKAWEYASTATAGVPKYKAPEESFTRHSWLDNLDYVCVQLYPRYGLCGADLALHNETTTKNFVGLGVEIAKRIADMEAGVGVLPMLAFNIHNPMSDAIALQEAAGSCEDDWAATLDYVTWQIEALREYAFVGAPGYTIADMPICFWDGDGELLSLPGEIRDQPEPQSIAEFMDLLFSVCDLNGVGDDGGFWDPDPPFSSTTQPADPFDMVFDMNGDRLLTSSDEADYTSICGGP